MNTTATQLQTSHQQKQARIITSESGRKIHACIFHAEQAKSVVIIACAMGVDQTKYEKFAQFLSENGHSVITFDYFGTGKSLHTHLRDCDTDVRQWGEDDCEAVIDFAKEEFSGLALQWIGHSLGGQLLGITRNTHYLTQAITMCSGTGYWKYNAPKTRRSILLMWYVISPISITLCGYYPGKKLKVVGDLPANVLWQWRRWCLVKDYAVGVEGEEIRQRFANVNFPITGISFTDDDVLSKRNIDALHEFFNPNMVTRLHINPKDIGETFIGHLGWFKDKYKQVLWQDKILKTLNSPF